MSTDTTTPSTADQQQRDPPTQIAPAQTPTAVVVGVDSMQGLATARTLRRHHVPVVGIAAPSKNALSSTNACQEMIFAPTADDDLIPHLLSLGARLNEKAVLFPCEDTNVLLISRHREQLAPYFYLLLPAPEVVEMLMDKVSFYKFAQQHDLPIPQTHFIESEDDLHSAIERLTFPCVLKPRDSAARRWEDETNFKAFKIHQADALIRTYRHFKRWTDCFIVQEWIEGADSDLYSCNCYFDSNSKPLVTFVARKLRQWPPETGVSCLGEEVRNDTVLEQTLHLFRQVNYHGLGYMEMKQDSRSGKFFIVEPNIGRPTGRSAIAEAGGVELVYTAYCDALGWELPKNRQQTYQGVKWVHLRKDMQSAIHYWQRGELTLHDWWRSLQGRKAYSLFSWRDPSPFLRDGLAAMRSFLSPASRKKRSIPGRDHGDGGKRHSRNS